jgi:hypothetical protein
MNLKRAREKEKLKRKAARKEILKHVAARKERERKKEILKRKAARKERERKKEILKMPHAPTTPLKPINAADQNTDILNETKDGDRTKKFLKAQSIKAGKEKMKQKQKAASVTDRRKRAGWCVGGSRRVRAVSLASYI